MGRELGRETTPAGLDKQHSPLPIGVRRLASQHDDFDRIDSNDARGRADAGKAGIGVVVREAGDPRGEPARTLKKLPLPADSRSMKRGSSRSAPAATRWIDRWLDACSDLAELSALEPDDGRGHRRDRRAHDPHRRRTGSPTSPPATTSASTSSARSSTRSPRTSTRWGTHPSWSRLLGSPVLYEQIEERLTELLGAEDTLVLPTITLIHMSVIPVLAGSGTIFLDSRAHKTIYDGCQLARARGATRQAVRASRMSTTSSGCCARSSTPPRLICIDGVNSMTGNAPTSRAFARLAREHDALLYVDDAHGFGVIGERGRRRAQPLRQARQQHRALLRRELRPRRARRRASRRRTRRWLAFLACPPELKRLLKTAAPPYLYSGPSPVASLATTLAGLRGQRARAATRSAPTSGARRSTCSTASTASAPTRPTAPGFPIIEVPLARHEDIDAVGRFLFENGIYVTLAAYPLVPRDEVGFRIQVTAANTTARDRAARSTCSAGSRAGSTCSRRGRR